MLTSDLAVSYRRGDKIFPFLIRTDDASLRGDAEGLIEIFEEFIGTTRDFYPRIERPLAIVHAGTATSRRLRGPELLHQHPAVVPIPGTRRAERIDENLAAAAIADRLTGDELAAIVTPAAHPPR